MRDLAHVTLATGHVRISRRAEVTEPAIQTCVGLLREALTASAPVPIPSPVGEEPCRLSATASGRALVATVWAPPLRTGDAPLVTLGVAAHSRVSPALWRRLCEAQALPTPYPGWPSAPWCGVVLHPTLAVHSVAAPWLGDLERCLAWAWIERRGHLIDPPAPWSGTCDRCGVRWRVTAVRPDGTPRSAGRQAPGDRLLCPDCLLRSDV